MLLEKVTGRPYAEYVTERLFTPNGLTQTYFCDTKRIIPDRAQGYDREQSGLVNTEFISMDLPFAAGR
jgi:CubicO group peptidase (beta-lactamase class C family)